MVAAVLPKEIHLELQRELASLVHQSHQELAALLRATLKEAVQEEFGMRARTADRCLLEELRGILAEHRRVAHRKLEPSSAAEDPCGAPAQSRRPKSAPEDLLVLRQERCRTPRRKRSAILTDSCQAASAGESEKGVRRVTLPGSIVPPVERSPSLALDSPPPDSGPVPQGGDCLPESLSEDGEQHAGLHEHGALGPPAGHPRTFDFASPSNSYPSTPRVRGTAGGEHPGGRAGEDGPGKAGADGSSTFRLSWLPSLMSAAANAVRASLARPSEHTGSEVRGPVPGSRGRGCLVWQDTRDTATTQADYGGSHSGAVTPPPSGQDSQRPDSPNCSVRPDASTFSLRPDAARPDTAGSVRNRTLHRDQRGPRVSRISIAHGLKRRSSQWHQVTTHESAFALLRSNFFDYAICALLFLNAFSIGMQVDHAARHLGEPQPEVFKHLEVVFCFVFLGEILLRLYVYRSRFFVLPHGRWNLLDLIVVTVQVFEIIMMWIFQDHSVTLPNFRILRFLRLIRILRLLRLINVIQELNKLVYLIMGSLWSFLWTTALLMLMTLVGGVFFTQLVADHLNGPSPGTGGDTAQDLSKYYGSLGDTILSLLAATSGGVDWMDVLRPLMQSHPNISFLLALLFMIYIAFSVLVVMNLVTGVFVDGAKRLTSQENEKDLMKKVQRAFVLTDTDNSNLITWPEFRIQLDSPFMKDFFNCVDIEPSHAATLFSLLDSDSTFSLSAEEFVQGALRLRGPAKAFDLAALQHENRLQCDQIQERFENLESALVQILPQLDLHEAGGGSGGTHYWKSRHSSAPPRLSWES